MSDDSLDRLRADLREFACERDWEQFHNPKNLAMALAGEVGELLEIFQWLTPEEADAVMGSPRADDVNDELADVAIYLMRLADILGVDLLEVAHAKLERNRNRFPPGDVGGRADVPPVMP
jgi:NTP pyrophosphatase (non-canonical NTP hydrolase)